MYTLDAWIAAWLVPLAVYVLISGLDDLFLDAAFVHRWVMFHVFGRPWFAWPTLTEVDAAPRRRIAIFVPLWHEHAVIGSMLERNIPATLFYAAEFFVGAYPNDRETVAAVRHAVRKFPRVHLALCPHDGPTSKADCLNWIYQCMLAHEERHGTQFDTIMTHDAEDVIHPQSLRWINYYAASHDMVQVPVLPLATPLRQWVHGLYCDEFAEFQTKDIPVRQMWGGFVPGNGVGTAFSREVLEKLAGAHSNRIFDPECLTEDYENGWRIHAMGFPQVFVLMRREGDSLLATREYFPHTFRTAVRQRARWVMGVVLAVLGAAWVAGAPAPIILALARSQGRRRKPDYAGAESAVRVRSRDLGGERTDGPSLAFRSRTSGVKVAVLRDFCVVGFSDGRARAMFAAHLRLAFRDGHAGACAGGKLAELRGDGAGAGALLQCQASRTSAGLGQDRARLS